MQSRSFYRRNRIIQSTAVAFAGLSTILGAICHSAQSTPLGSPAHINQMDNEGDDVSIEHTTVTVKRLKYVYALSIKAVDDKGHTFGPKGVAVDSDGNVYAAGSRLGVEVFDKTGQRLRSIGFDTGQEGGVAQPENGQLVAPFGVAVQGDTVSVTDGTWVQVFKTSGSYLGGVDLHDDADTGLTNLIGIAMSRDGSLFVVDSQKPGVILLTSSAQKQGAWGTKGNADGQFIGPRFVAVNKDGDVIIDDDLTSKIQVFGADGTLRLSFGKKGFGSEELSQPEGLALDNLGDIFVTTGTTVKAFDKTGQYLGSLGKTSNGKSAAPILGGSQGIAIDSSNNLYIANTNNQTIDVYSRLP